MLKIKIKFLKHFSEYIKIIIVLSLQIIWIHTLTGTIALGVPLIEYGRSLNDNIDDLSSLPIIDTSYDLDTEQSEARYDPRLLSEELRGSHTASKQGAESCIGSNGRYDHGQKITRLDPCEVCLCVDGEIFCWWKQCDYITKKNNKFSNNNNNNNMKQRKVNFAAKKKLPRPINSSKQIKYIPQSILTFPQNLPVHLPILNDTIINSETGYPIVYNNNNHNNNIENSASTILLTKDTPPKTKVNLTLIKLPNLLQITTAVTTAEKMTSTNIDFNKFNKTILTTGTTTPVDTILNEKLQRNATQRTVIKNIINSNFDDNNNNNNNNGNGDGVFMENTQDVIVSPSLPSLPSILDNKNDDFTNNNKLKQIKIDDFGVGGQHYVITSFGHVEPQTDILASDNVLEQFRNIPSSGSGPSVSGSSSSRGSGNEYNYKYITDNRINMTDIVSINHRNASSSSSMFDINGTPENTTKYYSTPIMTTTETTSLTLSASMSSSHAAITVTSKTPIEQNCIVMGISYKIGSILPQETGNCLQCICIKSVNQNDPPHVTCNPHNCPPLVLPDLFDTTGY